MSVSVETIGQLERRLNISLLPAEINSEVHSRLKNLARKVKLDGFRPGRVPLKVVAQRYEAQVRREVLGDALQKNFSEVVRAQNLKVAGYPRFEARPEGLFEYSAIFEIYPEVKVGDLSNARLQKMTAHVGAQDVEKTLEIMRKQRATFAPVIRAAVEGDRVTIDYVGCIDGRAFEGGQGADITLILGERRFLADFEDHLKGLKTGADATFEIRFPEDYHGKELAGKTATFEVKLKRIEETKLPPVDAEFARSLGIKDGGLEKMREEIKANLEREIKQRGDSRLRDQVMQGLLDRTEVAVPKSLIELEIEHLQTTARQDLEARGVKTEGMTLPREMFEAQAQRRVKLGMVLAEVVKAHGLQAQEDQIRTLAEERAQSYEQPAQVVQWIYQSPQRLRELESTVVENNVVQWALRTAEVEDTTVAFDELMGSRK